MLLINGDCLEAMRTLEVDAPIAILTDPPYGLGDRMKSGASAQWAKNGRNWQKPPAWDAQIAEGVERLPQHGPCIIWGGNYYQLPPTRAWLIWDKKQEHSSGHAELAWTNLDQPIRTFRMSRIEAYGRMNKQHPTQKPVELMVWCLSFLPKDYVILDPFMGSGTTGVACVRTGRDFVGMELDPDYYAIAVARVQAEQEKARQLELEVA